MQPDCSRAASAAGCRPWVVRHLQRHFAARSRSAAFAKALVAASARRGLPLPGVGRVTASEVEAAWQCFCFPEPESRPGQTRLAGCCTQAQATVTISGSPASATCTAGSYERRRSVYEIGRSFVRRLFCLEGSSQEARRAAASDDQCRQQAAKRMHGEQRATRPAVPSPQNRPRLPPPPLWHSSVDQASGLAPDG
eukprot:TRINITY_DN20566_c1_g1_i1.p1 TRINITY_DN20566_c1_g1~~TRINITY_DN20566_c1_g1_i1.p1  ORF type:complete len:195 (-),score=27.95 TRINITY_DN20566_c1_g1_i1:40-624(-)